MNFEMCLSILREEQLAAAALENDVDEDEDEDDDDEEEKKDEEDNEIKNLAQVIANLDDKDDSKEPKVQSRESKKDSSDKDDEIKLIDASQFKKEKQMTQIATSSKVAQAKSSTIKSGNMPKRDGN